MPRRAKKTQDGKPPVVTRDVNAAVRAVAALQLALEGHDYQTIATRAGYASRGAAFNAVQRELKRLIQHPAEEVRRMEIARLDGLLTIYLPKAMAGDGWSFDRVLRLMERRAGLLGLDARPDQQLAAGQTLIRQYDANVEAV